jgi:NAD-dependent dihydropyrimidine dehydrogenase PreA subunit
MEGELLIQPMQNVELRKAKNTLMLMPHRCTGCGRCVEVCPHGVFAIEGRKARLVNADGCMECGACQVNCVSGAIKVESGVGCASALIRAALTGKEPNCGGPDGCC